MNTWNRWIGAGLVGLASAAFCADTWDGTKSWTLLSNPDRGDVEALYKAGREAPTLADFQVANGGLMGGSDVLLFVRTAEGALHRIVVKRGRTFRWQEEGQARSQVTDVGVWCGPGGRANGTFSWDAVN